MLMDDHTGEARQMGIHTITVVTEAANPIPARHGQTSQGITIAKQEPAAVKSPAVPAPP